MSKDDTRRRLLDAGLAVLQRGELFKLGDVAREAGVSRQALYLHFETRASLAVEVARHSDEVFGLEQELSPLREAKDGRALLGAYAQFVARYNAKLHPVVRAVDAMRQVDPELRDAWRDRLHNRRAGGQAIAAQLDAWGELRPGWTVATAGDWITTLGSVKVWEELVLDLGWTKARFAKHVERLLCGAFLEVTGAPS